MSVLLQKLKDAEWLWIVRD